MCKCFTKMLQKILITVLLTIVFGMGVWICFDVYVVSDEFTYGKFKNAAETNTTVNITDMNSLVDAKVKSDVFQIKLAGGYYDYNSKCYFYNKPEGEEQKIYYKTDDAKPYVYINKIVDDQHTEAQEQIQCMDQQTLNNKGYYFEGLTQTVLGVGISACILYVIILIVVWVTGWCQKNQDFATVNSQYV